MVCSACNDKPVEKQCDTCGKLPPVLQINSEECPILFHTVELEGTRQDNPPYIGMYKNTLLTYTADSAKFLFNSDGVWAAITGVVRFNEILNRPKYGGVEMTSDTNIPDVDASIAVETARATAAEQSLSSSLSSEVAARQAADSAIETKLNTNVLYDLEMNADATAVQFVEDKKNLSTGDTSSETDTIPLASETQAGILNAAGYQSIKNSQDRLDALAGGAVSVANLPSAPTQAQLTTAWQTATGLTSVFNRASIFDSTNGKNWTYFDNTGAWEVTGELNQIITLENFSLGQAGLIVGDNQAGKVYAEQDGTGSVYGWDALSSRVSNAESSISTITTDITSLQTNKQDRLTAGDNISIVGSTISATDTTYDDFVGTDGATAGESGLVPAPTIADNGKYLKADGSWETPTGTTYTAGANIQITGNTISATDTTYSNFAGTDGTDAGSAGLVPAPTASDANKYLKSDGTWAVVSGGGGGSDGIPIDATFWGQGYNSATNSVNGSITLSNGSYIHNVTDPTLAQDAATKNYVDTAVASVEIATYTTSEFNNLWENA